MKEKLEPLGWVCAKCNCPGGSGFDCVNAKYRGIILQQRGLAFRIIKNSFVIESAPLYQLDQKMQMHGINH